MKSLPPFFRWLSLAALADWLILRTLTRAAIFMPKAPLVITAYQALNLLGQVAFTLTGLLGWMAVIWIAWQSWRNRRSVGLPLILLSLIALGVLGIFVPLGGWLVAGYQLLVIAAVGIIGRQAWKREGDARKKIAWFVPGLAWLVGGIYQALPALYTALQWSGPPPLTGTLFNLGELLVVLTPVALWFSLGRTANLRQKLLAAIPALAFGLAYLANPSLTAILSIWSTGLTLYLPWPVYAASLWLGSLVVTVSWRKSETTAWAMLLLAATGYAPQLSTQTLTGLVALWLLGPALSSQSAGGGVWWTNRSRVPVALSQATTGAGWA